MHIHSPIFEEDLKTAAEYNYSDGQKNVMHSKIPC